MTLSVILSGKGGGVVTTSPDRTMRDVAQLLSEMKIGAVLVTDADRHLLGIISERDIVRGIARHGAGMLDHRVSEHITRELVTATGETTVGEAMARMTEGRFRHMPVLRDTTLEGVVSIGDLVKFRLSEMETENKAMLDYITAAA